MSSQPSVDVTGNVPSWAWFPFRVPSLCSSFRAGRGGPRGSQVGLWSGGMGRLRGGIRRAPHAPPSSLSH